jgi:hypothetical protein
MCLLQDDIINFVSESASPPRLVNIPEEGKEKAKERREVGKGDDTVIVEDTSDKEDEETLQERFQLRSRFSRRGLPNLPLIHDPPTSLEASLPAPPRRPRNMARKRVAKNLKVTETTSQEVNSSSRVVEYLTCNVVYADNRVPSACKRFRLPTPSTKGTKATGRRWGSRLKEAAAQPPPWKSSCRSGRLQKSSRRRRSLRAGQSRS